MTYEEQQEHQRFQREVQDLIVTIDHTLTLTQAVVSRTATLFGVQEKDVSHEKVEDAGLKVNAAFEGMDNFEMLLIVSAHYTALLKTLTEALSKRLPVN